MGNILYISKILFLPIEKKQKVKMEVVPKYQNLKENCSNISAVSHETSFIHLNLCDFHSSTNVVTIYIFLLKAKGVLT